MTDVLLPSRNDASPARERFFELLRQSLASNSLAKLVLAKYRGPEADLLRATVRPLTLRDEACLSFVFSHSTRDITKNLPLAAGLARVNELLGPAFANAHLMTATQEIHLAISKKGQATLRVGAVVGAAAPSTKQHDREKHRFLDLDRPFLAELGVTDAQHRLIPAMARKWKQINKFVEVLDNALAAAPLPTNEVRVVDFGSGKGYLTFAMHDYLSRTRGLQAEVSGVELRDDLVRLCNAAVQRLALDGLHFEQGDVRSRAPSAIDIMVALHACDVATDYALHLGIRARAAIILCSPCCHKQIRPQMHSPRLLQPMLQHGIHLGQQAEMVTDSLRALLLEANGYDTQVFEFVSLEHTSKNKMILAVRRAQPRPSEELQAQIRDIKAFYGIREQCLETLLEADAASHARA